MSGPEGWAAVRRSILAGGVALSLAVAPALTGCGGDPTEGQVWGTAAGGAMGAGIGRAAAIGTRYPWAFTGAGLVAGAVVGYAIGDQLDPAANRAWSAATVNAAETGETARWSDDVREGQVSATGPASLDAGGRLCRPLRQEAGQIGAARPGFARGVVACRLADGSWEVTAPEPAAAETADTPNPG